MLLTKAQTEIIRDGLRRRHAELFGLACIKEEGAPMHPEDLDWECDPQCCEKCGDRWCRMLQAWQAWEIYRYRNPFA